MIYFDYAATTPMDPVVLEAMQVHLQTTFGNPSSAHQLGRQARQVLESTRTTVATYTGYRSDEVIFTSTGSESIAIALHSLATQYQQKHGTTGLIITSVLEHKAITEALQQLVLQGWQVEYVPLDKYGTVQLEVLEQLLQNDCAFVTLQWVNSEIGTIQPLEDIVRMCAQYNVALHTDASQAVAHLPFPILLPDYMSFSAHKCYGPKGVSVLCAKKQQSITPLIFGGGQEFGLRSGTENVPAIAGLQVAIQQLLSHRESYEQHIAGLHSYFVTALESLPSITVLPTVNTVPSIINIAAAGLSAEALLIKADMAGICFSTGSACNIGSREPSATLLVLGLTPEQAGTFVRISLGPWNTTAEIDACIVFLQSLQS